MSCLYSLDVLLAWIFDSFSTGLATIGIFRPFRFSESQPKQTALIQLLLLTLDPAKYDTVFTLDEACGRNPSTSKSSSHMSNLDPNNSSSLGMSFTAPDSPAKELSNALNKANIHDVIALLKWSLRHTRLTFKDFNSKTSFDWYDEFVSKESRNQYPTNSFSKFLLSKLPETTSIYLNSILSLLTTIGSHHSSNAMPCPRLCGILGFWILGRIGKESPSWNLNDSLKDWEKSKNSLNHLCLAFIREMENEKGVISIPTKLKELIDGYPYFGATRTQNSSPDESITQESKVDNEGTRTTTPTIQAPTFPLAFSPPPQRALRINLRSQNLVISSKRPRAPSETLRAAFGVASINEQNPETSSLTQEETVWKFIVEEGRKAEDSSKAPRKRELSRGGTSDSSSPVPPLPSTPNTFHSTNSLSSISSANPTPAQEEERERIRDEAREKTIVLEDHARILKLVGKSLRERRKLNEELEKEKEKKEKNDQNSTTTNGSANVSGLGSPYSSAKGLDKMAEPNSGSPEIDLTPGSESTFLSSPGSRPSPFSRSVTEFGTFSSPSSTNNTSSMRRCTSQNASTILDGAPELDTLPEDGQSSSYTWLDGFSKTEASPDLSFSTVTLPTSNSSSTPDSFATSPRPRRQSSFGSIKRRSIRSPNHSNLKNLFEPLPDSLPPPPPSFQISSVEIFSFDEAFQNTWQDCLLEGAMPPFVLIGLKDSLLVKATEMLDSKKLDLIRKEKINYLLVDEVATPPLPKSKPSQQASSIDGQSTSRRSFAPSIRSLSASIRRMTGSWRRSKKEV